MNTPMKKSLSEFKKLGLVAGISVFLATGCATTKAPDGSAAVRSKLTQLQTNPQLASLAPVAINDAELAVRAAEKPTDDKALSKHLVFLADRKVEDATAQAQSRFYEDQRKALSEQREGARLDMRTLEADKAHSEADRAHMDADAARQQARREFYQSR